MKCGKNQDLIACFKNARSVKKALFETPNKRNTKPPYYPSGKKGINRSKARRRCDIRTKIDITSLTNQNLIKDDLATVAYFVQELRGE